MDKSTIIKELSRKISRDIIGQPDKFINDQESLISSGLIDSFSLVDLALIVEDSYGVRIEDYELNADAFDNINELAQLIIEKQNHS